jgi:alpha-beta hydrolase superfamily lysophospholipase
MRTAAYDVRVERHEAEGIPVWLFANHGAAGRLPLVFVLHGLHSRKERHLDLCLRLANAGFRACAVDSRSHGERADADTPALQQARTTAEFAAAFARSVAGTVEDVAALATYFGGDAYAIVGHSMGGYVATLAALADTRVNVIVNISGSLDVGRTTTEGNTEFDRWVPERRAAELLGRAVLLLHGDSDETIPVEGARRLYTALCSIRGADGPQKAAYVEYAGVGHELTPQMTEEAVAWVRRHLPAPEVNAR